jgi:hypothetical protein
VSGAIFGFFERRRKGKYSDKTKTPYHD